MGVLPVNTYEIEICLELESTRRSRAFSARLGGPEALRPQGGTTRLGGCLPNHQRRGATTTRREITSRLPHGGLTATRSRTAITSGKQPLLQGAQHGTRSVAHAELEEDVGHVILHRPLGQVQAVCNLPV